MKYEVGLVKILLPDGSFPCAHGEPIVSKIICTCGNCKDALLIAEHNNNEVYLSAIRDDKTKRWVLYNEYPTKEIKNLEFETDIARWDEKYSIVMWNKINEIIDYINENK